MTKLKFLKKLKIGIFLALSFIIFDAFPVFGDASTTQEAYINVLEKTNQQLSLYWTPINIIVAVLTFLVAFLAVGLTIGFAMMSYRQGKDYQKSLARIQQYFKKIIDERNAKTKEIEEKINDTIVMYEKKLTELSKEPSDQKSEIEEIKKSIQQLKNERDLLGTQTGSITVTPEYLNFGPQGTFGLRISKSLHSCSSCGYSFFVDSMPQSLTLAYIGEPRTVTCPKCGNVDKL